ncbi:MAG: CDP-alcohol phosphatidyltransferase family protein [Arenimonas sp.]
MTLSWIPNAITIARMVMALPLLWLLMNGHYPQAFWLALIAGASDALDGLIAKRFGWRSVIGGVLDPIADKLLLTVCFFGLWWSQQLPTWLIMVVLVRDLVILLGAYIWWRLVGAFKPSPSGISKVTTLAQLVLVALVLANMAGFPLVPGWVPPLMLATAAITLVSGADYVIRYGLRAWRVHRSRQ